jgi:hypothetical protein
MRTNRNLENGLINAYHIDHVIDTIIYRIESGWANPPNGVGIAIADSIPAVSAWQ